MRCTAKSAVYLRANQIYTSRQLTYVHNLSKSKEPNHRWNTPRNLRSRSLISHCNSLITISITIITNNPKARPMCTSLRRRDPAGRPAGRNELLQREVPREKERIVETDQFARRDKSKGEGGRFTFPGSGRTSGVVVAAGGPSLLARLQRVTASPPPNSPSFRMTVIAEAEVVVAATVVLDDAPLSTPSR